MPWDDFSDHVTTQAVGAKFLESEEGKDTFDARSHGDRAGTTPTRSGRPASRWRTWISRRSCRRSRRPLLMTNGTHDILCPPELAPSGLGARQMAAMNANVTTHEFPDIGHADLLECPADAVRIVSEFFRDSLVAD